MPGKHARRQGLSQPHEELYCLPAFTFDLACAFGFTRVLALDFNLDFADFGVVLPAAFALRFFWVEATVTFVLARLPRLVRFPAAGFEAGTAARYSSS